MPTHVARSDVETAALCGKAEPEDVVVTLADALAEDDQGFDCADCHKGLTGGQRHSRAEQ